MIASANGRRHVNRRIGASEEDRAGMMFSGLDPKHWFKIVRNSVCFGGGRLPHGGFLADAPP